MLGSCDLIAFVPTLDASRARAFYEGVLGLPLMADDRFALVFEARGTMLRITKVQELNPAPFTILGWKVLNIQQALASLREKGVKFQVYPGLEQDEGGVWVSPAGAKVAWFKDPDGNTLSLTEFAG